MAGDYPKSAGRTGGTGGTGGTAGSGGTGGSEDLLLYPTCAHIPPHHFARRLEAYEWEAHGNRTGAGPIARRHSSGQGVRCRGGRDRRVESGVETGHRRDVDEDSGLPFKRPQGFRLVERCQVGQKLESVDNPGVDLRRRRELCPAMDNSMADGIDRPVVGDKVF